MLYRCGTLSGGERNRLLLARLFARPANVLRKKRNAAVSLIQQLVGVLLALRPKSAVKRSPYCRFGAEPNW